LAIYYPEVTFHLVDRIGKKLRVAQDIAERIGLKNVTIQHGDVKEVKGKFDFVVSRAVMDLGDMVPLIKRLIATGDRNAVPNGLVCLKGGDLSGEVSKFRNQVLIDELSSYFNEEFFKTKKIVYLPL
jgi:16S rRNA (guanine527-N7)-methyltransferase